MADKPTTKPAPTPVNLIPQRKALAAGLKPNTGGSDAKGGPATRW